MEKLYRELPNGTPRVRALNEKKYYLQFSANKSTSVRNGARDDQGRRQLRSADSRTCVVRRTYSNSGDRCFSAADPRLWSSLMRLQNSLQVGLREMDIGYGQFERLLKASLFGHQDRGTL